jgi:hypothetical protein
MITTVQTKFSLIFPSRPTTMRSTQGCTSDFRTGLRKNLKNKMKEHKWEEDVFGPQEEQSLPRVLGRVLK